MKKIVLIFVAIFITILMLIVIFGDFKVSSSKIECTTANTNTCTNTYTDTVINDYIDNFCDETKCSSVSVVVMQEGKITIYGDEDALYQIGSMTKAFTGLAVLKLINEKVLSEDDIISDHIKGFTAYYEKEARDITIGQLLTHTSGYTNKETDYPSALEGMSLRAWTDTISGSLNLKRYMYSGFTDDTECFCNICHMDGAYSGDCPCISAFCLVFCNSAC